MSTSYEDVKAQSILLRKYRKVDLIQEYKDNRGRVPPPFTIISVVLRVLWNCCRGTAFTRNEPSTAGDLTSQSGFSDDKWWGQSEELLQQVS